jgi:hypothetical protein
MSIAAKVYPHIALNIWWCNEISRVTILDICEKQCATGLKRGHLKQDADRDGTMTFK